MDLLKRKWEKPKILDLGSLPDALGNCQTGSTAQGIYCTNGQNTGPSVSHLCQTGGIAKGGCTLGTSPTRN